MSHSEAERLISSRLDAPLDANQNRVLLAHLATCDSCRAFAASMETMSAEFRALPVLPASPVVTRQVRARIAQQPSPWAWFSGVLFNGRWGAIPAAVAGVAIVAIVAAVLLLNGSGQNGGTPPLAAPTTNLAQASSTSDAPHTPDNGNSSLTVAVSQTPKFVNIQVTSTPTPVDTVAPTDTTVATETATAPPADTATNTPPATATTAPSDTAVPTETPAPTQAPAVTATSLPVIVPSNTATEVPADTATATATLEPTQAPTDTATPQPTETTAPTETPSPTETPTELPTETQPPATPVEQPTDAPPTKEPTRKPTKTPKPTETPTSDPETAPTIAPKGGDQSSQVIDTPPADQSTDGSAPTDQSADTETPTTEPGDSQIVPIGGANVVDTDTPEVQQTDTPKPEKKATEKPKGSDSSVIGQAQQLAQMPAAIEPGAVVRANPDGTLFVISDSSGCTVYDVNGNVIATLNGAARPVWTPGGSAFLYSAPSDSGQIATVWLASSQTILTANASSDRPFVDYPAGADANSFYFVRAFTDDQGGIEVHSLSFDAQTDASIWSGDGSLAGDPVVTDAGVVFSSGGSFWIVTANGNGTQTSDDPFGNVQAPLRNPNGAGFAFISGDKVISADAGQPASGSAMTYDSGSGGGFTFSPTGNSLAIATGDTLSVFGADGSAQGQVSSSNGAALTVVAWTSDGIIVVENGEQAILRLVSPDSVTSGGN